MNLVCSRRSIRWLLLAVTTFLGAGYLPPLSPGHVRTVRRPRTQDQRQLEHTVAQSPKQLGGYYALVIGNNDYRYVRKLKTAVNDAEAVEKELRERFGFKTQLLLNADHDQILSALIDYRRTLDDSANLLIYYAGHGYYDKDVDKAYWIPVDAQSESSLKWISADDVTTNLKGIAAKHILVISDSCYSGMMTRDANLGLTPKERQRYLEKMIDGKSRTLMSSGGNEPVADGGGSGHSVFAAALLRGLDRMEHNEFTSEELFYHYVRERVAGSSGQAPEYSVIRDSGHESGDFVFMRSKTAVAKNLTGADGSSVSLSGGSGEASGAVAEKNPGNANGESAKTGTAATPLTGPRGELLETYGFDTVTLDSKGSVVERRKGQARYFSENLGGGVSLEMVEIPAGTFMMGTADSQIPELTREFQRYCGNDNCRSQAAAWAKWQTPQHQVSIARFYIGRFEVTQAQWRAVARLPKVNRDLPLDPSHFKGDDLPVEQVSWDEAMEFCARLSRKTGLTYRLPSEAEWEYACRAGTKTEFAFGDAISADLANYGGNYPFGGAEKGVYRNKTVPVGSLGVANGFGLYDMHGNVWEWCLDPWHENYYGAPSDGSVWEGGDTKQRVQRGGSWYLTSNYSSSTNRLKNKTDYRYFSLGFRVAVSARR